MQGIINKKQCAKNNTQKKNKFQVLQSGLFFCNKTVVILTCFIFLASITVVRGAVFVSIILQCHAVTTDWQNLRRPRCCRTRSNHLEEKAAIHRYPQTVFAASGQSPVWQIAVLRVRQSYPESHVICCTSSSQLAVSWRTVCLLPTKLPGFQPLLLLLRVEMTFEDCQYMR